MRFGLFEGRGNSYYNSIFSDMNRLAEQRLASKGLGGETKVVEGETKGQIEEIVLVKN